LKAARKRLRTLPAAYEVVNGPRRQKYHVSGQWLSVTPRNPPAHQQTFRALRGPNAPESSGHQERPAIVRPQERRVQSAIDNRTPVVKKKNEYEGKSNDIVDNKGPVFLSHDVYENKGCYAVYPTIFMKPNELPYVIRMLFCP
jgi:hypothetical protein